MEDRKNRVGLRIKMTDKGTEISGEGIDNLKVQIKNEVIEEIRREIIKPENDKIRGELINLNEAIQKNDKSLMKNALKKLIEKGTGIAVEILIKIIQAQIGS